MAEPRDEDEAPVEQPKRKHVRTTGLQAPRVRIAKPRRKTNRPPDWRSDLAVRRRLDLLMNLMLMGTTDHALFERLQQGLFQLGQKPVSRYTFEEDKRRVGILISEQSKISSDELIAQTRQLLQEAWRQISSKNEAAQVRSGSLREARELVTLLGRFGGILDDHNQVNVQVGVKVDQQPQIEFLNPESPSLRAAMAILGMGEQPKLLTDGTDEIDPEGQE